MSGNYKSPSPLLTVKTRPLPENMEPDELSRTSITKYTKHYYIGTERISSAIGTMKNLGLLCENNWSGSQDIVEEMSDKTLVAGNVLTADYDTFEKELQLPEPFLYRTYLLCAARFHEPINYDAYWYHPDHLGSSSYITNLAGEVSQHMEYLPFGETLVEEHLNSYNSPYKFNAKEYDAETGWYYYGARYYNPKWSVWLSVDPASALYPSFCPYSYTLQNPVRYVDPTGMVVESPDDYYIDSKTGKLLGQDGADTDNIRTIDASTFNDIKASNNGTTSSQATEQLQANSSLVTVNKSQIDSDIATINNETVSDQSAERQLYLLLSYKQDDSGNWAQEVTSKIGQKGTDGLTTFSASVNSDGTPMKNGSIVIGGVHTHNKISDPNRVNVPGTSADDRNTAQSFGVSIYSIDSYTGQRSTSTSGPAMHRVTPDGVQTNNIGTTNNNNIGSDALKIFSGIR